MPGYSNKSLAAKLGIKPGFRILLLHAPPDLPAALGTLPDGAIVALKGKVEGANIVMLFVSSTRDLRAALPPAARSLTPGSMLWVAWPKKASRIITDLKEAEVRAAGLATGLVDVKVCAVTEIWSGLKFLHRRKQES
jgi:hypothetical protein